MLNALSVNSVICQTQVLKTSRRRNFPSRTLICCRKCNKSIDFRVLPQDQKYYNVQILNLSMCLPLTTDNFSGLLDSLVRNYTSSKSINQ